MQDDQVIQLEDVMEPGQTIQDVVEEAPQTAQAQQAPVETEQARNFRQLKESREREERARVKAEKERDEAIRYIQSIQSQQPQPKPIEEDDFQIGAEDIAEGKHVKRVYNEVKELRKQLKQYQQQSTETIAEARLKAAYTDADQVLSQDNIEQFRQRHPELASTIFSSNGDTYSKMVSAYTMIKQLGVYQQPDMYTAEKELAQRNSNKPRPLTSISAQQGDTPMSRANAFAQGPLDEDMKKKYHKEMMQFRQGYL